jgi:transposase InsO family protein
MTTLAAPAEEDPHQRRALARFSAVNWITQAIQNGLSLSRAVHAAAEQAWGGRVYSAATLEEWYYRYRHGGFGGLHDRPRHDRGTHRTLDASALQALVNLRREHPQLTLKSLADELVRRDILHQGAYSLSTLQRRLTQAGLDRRSLRAGAGILGGPTKAFELPLPNMLWMADAMHGPTLRLADGTSQRTFLFSVLDDCSRLCPHAQYYPKERTECFLDTLRRALQTRGVPEKLYTDNGGPFRSHHLQIVCANFQIRLLHARPHHAWSKGKQEKFYQTVQSQFQQALVFAPAHSLEELNQRFWQWLEGDYHQRVHRALDGQSPSQRFASGLQTLRCLPSTTDWERLFLMREKRRVRKDATVSLQGELFEVATVLRGQEILVEYDPIGLERVDVYLGQRHLGRAVRCNKHLNARISPSNTYDRNDF